MVAGSYEHYHTTPVQRTVPAAAELNQEGRALFERAHKDAQSGLFKDYFATYHTVSVPTGMWIADESSKHQTQGYRGNVEVMTILCTRHDLAIYGSLQSTEDDTIMSQTSSCIFITNHWALTSSGNLYALGVNKGRI